MEAHQIQNKKIFHLADLLHNIPLALDKVPDEAAYDEILDQIIEKAKDKGIEKWVEYVINPQEGEDSQETTPNLENNEGYGSN
jgi:hypothetical protein